jgi:ABC-type dipeptide/oligopeptide/nickel transport system permease subunit
MTYSSLSTQLDPGTEVDSQLVLSPDPAPAPRRRWRPRVLATTLSMKFGVAMLALYVVVALVAVFWTPSGSSPIGNDILISPSHSHLLGTDRLGADILALVFGGILGTLAAYYGGLWDAIVMRIAEIFQAFPTLLFAMLIVSAIGPGLLNVIVVLACVGLPSYLRLSRGEIMSRRTAQFAEAARMSGCRSWRVAFRHLLPNSMAPLLAFTSVNAAWVALITSSLGYLGIGIQPGVPEWGNMISLGQQNIITGQWWVSFFPGLAILGLTGSLYLIGDGLGDIFDPRRRGNAR